MRWYLGSHPDWIMVNRGYAFMLVREKQWNGAEARCYDLFSRIPETTVLNPESPRVVAIAEVLLTVFRLQERKHEAVQLKQRFPRLDQDDKEVMQSITIMPMGKLRHWRQQGKIE